MASLFRVAGKTVTSWSSPIFFVFDKYLFVSKPLFRIHKLQLCTTTAARWRKINNDVKETWGCSWDIPHSSNIRSVVRVPQWKSNTGLDANYIEYLTGSLSLCVIRARTASNIDSLLQQIYEAKLVLTYMKDSGFRIVEEVYGEFMLCLIDFGLVDDFLCVRKLITDANPDDSHPRLVYYEILLWEGVKNEDKIQELCHSVLAVPNIAAKKDLCVTEHLLLALSAIGRKKEILMLLDGYDITKITSVANLSCIFRCFGKLKLETLAKQYFLELKMSGMSAEIISKFIYEYGISIPKLRVDNFFQKFQALHRNLKMLPAAAQYEKLIEHCCQHFRVPIAFMIMDEAYKAGVSLSLEAFHSILRRWNRIPYFMDSVKKMEISMVKPNDLTFSYIIARCHRERDVVKVYADMKNAGVAPTKPVFLALVNAYASSCQFERALEVMMEASNVEYKLSTNSLIEIKSALIIALASCGELPTALGMYTEIKHNVHDMDPKVHSILIKHLLKQGDLKQSVQLLEEIHGSCTWVRNCFLVVTHCLQHENLSITVDLLAQLKEYFPDTVQGKEMMLVEVFYILAETKASMQFGVNLLHSIKKELSLRPLRKSLDFLLSACANAKDDKAASIIWEEYKMAGFDYTVLTHLRMYQALLASGNQESADIFLNKIPREDSHVEAVIKNHPSKVGSGGIMSYKSLTKAYYRLVYDDN